MEKYNKARLHALFDAQSEFLVNALADYDQLPIASRMEIYSTAKAYFEHITKIYLEALEQANLEKKSGMRLVTKDSE